MTLGATGPQPDRAQAAAAEEADSAPEPPLPPPAAAVSTLTRAPAALAVPGARPPEDSIPPDMAAVLRGGSAHPELVGRRCFRTPLPASELTRAALDLAGFAAELEHADPAEAQDRGGVWASAAASESAGSEAAGGLPASGGDFRARMHVVGRGGVLHFGPSDRPRAVVVARGVLDQRGSDRPGLRPGVVRLVPAGRSVILADLAGAGALVVDVMEAEC